MQSRLSSKIGRGITKYLPQKQGWHQNGEGRNEQDRTQAEQDIARGRARCTDRAASAVRVSGDLRDGVSDPEEDWVHHIGDVQAGLERRGGCGSCKGRKRPQKNLNASKHELVIDQRPLAYR